MLSKALFFAALLASSAFAVDLENYTFEQYLTDFSLKYHPSEVSGRKKLFDEELARVRAHNAKNNSWKESMTKFSTMTKAEKKAYRGRSKGHHAAQKGFLKNSKSRPANFNPVAVDLLPRNVDWREKGVVSAVKDQGHCGSCWAFASTATIESHVAIQSGLLFDLSVQQIAMCTPNPNQCGGSGGCNGATAELAFDYVTGSAGLYQEFQYSYSSYYGAESACSIPQGSPVATIDGFYQLEANNYTELMNAVATLGPIAISVDASNWSAYSGGIFNGCNQKNPDLDHAVILMGYGEENGQKYWLVRNSWSAAWGEKGYIRVARLDTEEELCGIDITPHDGTACTGEDQPVKACGTCGILFDSAYPLNARAF